MCACTTVSIWKSEDNFQRSVLSFYHIGPGDQTQVINHGSDFMHWAILPACPQFINEIFRGVFL